MATCAQAHGHSERSRGIPRCYLKLRLRDSSTSLGMTISISAVLFAGGESRRMGTDKATLPFGEKPLWQHQLALLRQLQPAKILVSARVDPIWRPNDVDLV